MLKNPGANATLNMAVIPGFLVQWVTLIYTADLCQENHGLNIFLANFLVFLCKHEIQQTENNLIWETMVLSFNIDLADKTPQFH